MTDRWTHTSTAQQVTVGSGALDTITDTCRVLGIRRALLITTSGRASSDGGQRVVRSLGRSLVDTFDGVGEHVPATTVQSAAGGLRSQAIDGLVSFGGGSAIDTAKALAFFSEHEAGTPGAGFADRPMLPHIAIPTTLVGAPYTTWFSLLDPQSRRSTTAGGPTMAPSVVVIDPELGIDLPAELLAGSIATAVAHAVETLWAPNRTPEAAALAETGLRTIAIAGPASMADPAAIESRSDLVSAAVLCGRARQTAGDGLHHVLAHLVAARAGVPTGLVHAALLPVTTRFTFDLTPDAADRVASALGGPSGEASELLVQLLSRLGPKRGLSELGVSDQDLDAVARQAGAHRGVQVHPRPVGEGDVRALLEDAC